jgi:hypothetical protein
MSYEKQYFDGKLFVMSDRAYVLMNCVSDEIITAASS